MSILSSPTSPLLGNNVQTLVENDKRSSNNIFYSPIPHELIYTIVQKPEITVTSNGIQGVCQGDCGFKYIDDVSEITAASLAGSVLTIDGTLLKGGTVRFAGRGCSVATDTEIQVVCTLGGAPVAGSHDVEMLKTNGRVKSSATKIDVGVVITSTDPADSLSETGGEVLTITGTGYPATIAESKGMTVKIDTSDCLILTTHSTQITCKTKPFTSTTPNLVVTVNTKTATKVLANLAAVLVLSAVTPTSYSPVLKTTLSFSFTNSGTDLVAVDLRCQIAKGTEIVKMRVLSVDNGNKVIEVKYPGTYSGEYEIQMSHTTIGDFKSSLTFLVRSRVTNIVPRSGSVLGGQIITITGENFSPDIKDNQVTFGKIEGEIIAATATELKARVPARQGVEEEAIEVFVILKAAEVAQCSDRSYSYSLAKTPTVTTMTQASDVLTIAGTNFNGDNTNTKVKLDGLESQVLTATATQITAKIIAYKTLATKVEVETIDGKAFGSTTLSFTPEFVSITPRTGRSSGTLMTFGVNGIGQSDTILVKAGATILCAPETISLESVTCYIAGEYADQMLTLSVNGASVNCVNADAEKCQVSLQNAQAIVVSSVALAGKVLTLTGLSLVGDSVTIWVGDHKIENAQIVQTSATEIQATSLMNLPPGSYPIIAHFTVSTNTFKAHVTSSNIVIPFSASGPSITCGFPGNCELTLTSPGVLNSAKVTVCGLPCTPKSSTDQIVKCSVPPLVTTHSSGKYHLNKPALITGIYSSDVASMGDLAFDLDTSETYSSSSSTCYIQSMMHTSFTGSVGKV